MTCSCISTMPRSRTATSPVTVATRPVLGSQCRQAAAASAAIEPRNSRRSCMDIMRCRDSGLASSGCRYRRTGRRIIVADGRLGAAGPTPNEGVQTMSTQPFTIDGPAGEIRATLFEPAPATTYARARTWRRRRTGAPLDAGAGGRSRRSRHQGRHVRLSLRHGRPEDAGPDRHPPRHVAPRRRLRGSDLGRRRTGDRRQVDGRSHGDDADGRSRMRRRRYTAAWRSVIRCILLASRISFASRISGPSACRCSSSRASGTPSGAPTRSSRRSRPPAPHAEVIAVPRRRPRLRGARTRRRQADVHARVADTVAGWLDTLPSSPTSCWKGPVLACPAVCCPSPVVGLLALGTSAGAQSLRVPAPGRVGDGARSLRRDARPGLQMGRCRARGRKGR